MPLVRTPLCESVDPAAGLDFTDERLTEPLVLRLSSTEGASTEIEIRLPEVRREEIDPFTVARVSPCGPPSHCRYPTGRPG